ncbi:hypothetical protein ACHAXS_007925 [Conticribra weissflogii]
MEYIAHAAALENPAVYTSEGKEGDVTYPHHYGNQGAGIICETAANGEACRGSVHENYGRKSDVGPSNISTQHEIQDPQALNHQFDYSFHQPFQHHPYFQQQECRQQRHEQEYPRNQHNDQNNILEKPGHKSHPSTARNKRKSSDTATNSKVDPENRRIFKKSPKIVSNLERNQTLLSTASRIDNSIIELLHISSLLTQEQPQQQCQDPSLPSQTYSHHLNYLARLDAIHDIQKYLIPLLAITAHELRDLSNLYAPYSGMKQLFSRRDAERRREVERKYKTEGRSRRVGMLMIRDFVENSTIKVDGSEIINAFVTMGGKNPHLVGPIGNSIISKGKITSRTTSVAILEPRNGKSYTKSEALRVVKMYPKGSKDRAHAINAMIKMGYVAERSRRTLHRLIKRDEEGAVIYNDSDWGALGRPRIWPRKNEDGEVEELDHVIVKSKCIEDRRSMEDGGTAASTNDNSNSGNDNEEKGKNENTEEPEIRKIVVEVSLPDNRKKFGPEAERQAAVDRISRTMKAGWLDGLDFNENDENIDFAKGGTEGRKRKWRKTTKTPQSSKESKKSQHDGVKNSQRKKHESGGALNSHNKSAGKSLAEAISKIGTKDSLEPAPLQQPTGATAATMSTVDSEHTKTTTYSTDHAVHDDAYYRVGMSNKFSAPLDPPLPTPRNGTTYTPSEATHIAKSYPSGPLRSKAVNAMISLKFVETSLRTVYRMIHRFEAGKLLPEDWNSQGRASILTNDEIDAIVEKWTIDHPRSKSLLGTTSDKKKGKEASGLEFSLDEVKKILAEATRERIARQGGDPNSAPKSFNRTTLKNYAVLFQSKVNNLFVAGTAPT